MSNEPLIGKFPTEIFGHPYNSQNPEAKTCIMSQHCPFLNTECKKPRKSEPHLKVGTCSAGYKGSFKDKFSPVIICPHRFIEPIVFETIQKIYLAKWEQVEWVREVGMGVGGNIDYVAVKRNPATHEIEDFLCVEFQAAGTTGTPWEAVQQLKKDGKFSSDSYNYGINWANEFMKTMMQQVYKKGKIIKSWNRKIIFVVQDLAIEYLKSAVDSNDLRNVRETDEIHFVTFGMDWVGDKWALAHKGTFSTDLEGINRILGGAHQDRYPSESDFKKFIQTKGKKDGSLPVSSSNRS